MKYLLIDAQNLLFRAKHATHGDAFLKTGMALHIVFNSIRAAWKKFDADHVIFCFDGRSWRKDLYPRYKANRIAIKMAKDEEEVEEDRIFFDMCDKFQKFIEEKTNCTVLKHDRCEADDFVARWIQIHSETEEEKEINSFIILSSDSDFQQLISNNVIIYDGMSQKTYRHDGIFDDKNKPCVDKNGVALEVPNPDWILFEKCIRGDTSDNIMSAYPGARLKGSKKSVGLREAYEDMNEKTYAWVNFMHQTWIDQVGKEHLVKDRYEENKMLIDLTQQPQEIKDLLDMSVVEVMQADKHIPMIGIHFMKFCGLYELDRISKSPDQYVEFLSAPLFK